jgi:hypothetical protein
MPEANPPSRGRRLVRWALKLVMRLTLLVALVILAWFGPALYHRFVRFPEEVADLASLRADRQPVLENTGWREYRGVLHSHSVLSHDCNVSFEDIQRVLRDTGRDFICLSDHCADGRADFSRPWRGLHGGRLFIPGYEMKEGLMPFGVASDIVLSNRTDGATLARQILAGGGLCFYAHPEEPRVWDRPELTGMEIYNAHADFKDEKYLLVKLLPDIALNYGQYPEQVLRLCFDRPTANLDRWDQLNQSRHLTGIGGNDCHQNTGLRLQYTAADTLRFSDTGKKTLGELKLNWLTRPLARLCFGPLEPGRVLFHIQLDPYDRMARHVSTHVWARDLTEPAVLDALRAGRAFVGFDLLADSTGFICLANGPGGRAVMGETMKFSPGTRFRARTPQACRFTVVKDGQPAYRQEGRVLDWAVPGPGLYRLEAELKIRGAWTPWIYANPLWLR